MMFLASDSATRSMYTGASNVESNSATCSGKPSLFGRRPQGLVVLGSPTSVVGASWPPHSVDAVVGEEHGDVLATISGVNDLGGADGGKVAVALVRDDGLIRMRAFGDRGNGGCVTVRGL